MSTTLAGYAIDHFGGQFTFALLASVAACGLGLVWLMLPETRREPIGSTMTLALPHTLFLDSERRPTIMKVHAIQGRPSAPSIACVAAAGSSASGHRSALERRRRRES